MNRQINRQVLGCLLIALSLAMAAEPAGQRPAATVVGRPLAPTADALASASEPLLERLRTEPFAYFRFVNRQWVERVCGTFADDIRRLPTVRLHGDAHVEQYAMTRDAWGLDDFDDSARGPALVDIARFLGSIDLVTRQRGWQQRRDQLFDRFFAGYLRGIREPQYQPPQPPIVRALTSATVASRESFLTAGELQMEPMPPELVVHLAAALHVFSQELRRERPELPPTYLDLVKAGWLHVGIGSAGVGKFLARVQGASDGPDDDELLEGKRAPDLSGLSCLDVATVPPTSRVILGNQHVGRLRHSVLLAAPDAAVIELGAQVNQLRYWYVRSWDPTYREITISDYRTYQELSDVAYDAGVQIAQGSLHEETGERAAALRKQTLDSIPRLERRIRSGTIALVEELMQGWREFAAASR